MQDIGVNACTDITGFGFLGHAFEMAKASQATFYINSKEVPLMPDVLRLIEIGMLTRGDKNNREYVGETISFTEDVARETQSALFDPQTAGGLLISLSRGKAESYLELIPDAVIVGEVKEQTNNLIEVF
jgi:selenide,water dikinase